MQGTSVNPGLIPRTLDLLFDSLKEKLELKKSVYKFKPDKFNEIASLNETELKLELAHKEQLLRLANYKELAIERVESCESLKDDPSETSAIDECGNGGGGSLLSSKKFGGSLDSLSAYTSENGGGNTADRLTKVRVPENKKYAIWISFYELYNDNIYDLLTVFDPKNKLKSIGGSGANNNNLNDRATLRIREDMNKIPYVEGLTHVPVFSTNEAIRILKYGEKRLQKSNNSINASSSRSHAVFCLKFVAIERDATGVSDHSTVTINQLSFCDLAGIERLSKTGAQGLTQKESSCINSSLSALSRCINQMIFNQKATSQKNSGQIPFRDNKLTRLFQAYFEGRGMVKMVVNLNPSLAGFDESVNVLKFASIANQIQLDLNDNDKIQYIYENEQPKDRSRETVAWEAGVKAEETIDDDDVEEEEDEEEETQVGETEEEDDEEEEEGSGEDEDETGSEETESGSGEEDDDDDDEEDEDESEEDDEEEEDETSVEETLDETKDVTVEMKCKKPRFQVSSTKKSTKTTNSSYRKTPGRAIKKEAGVSANTTVNTTTADEGKKKFNVTSNKTIDKTNDQTNNTEMESESDEEEDEEESVEEDDEDEEAETTNEATNVDKTNVNEGLTTVNDTTYEETG